MIFDKENHILKMQPFVKKLVEYMNSKGVSYADIDGKLENVIFFNDEREVKIAYCCFYRFSGCAIINKTISDKKGNITTELVDLTDELFFSSYWKSFLNYLFNL